MIDAPCGDLAWLRTVALPLDKYLGLDIVPALVRRLQREQPIPNADFQIGDLVSDRLPQVDAILSRDSFIHFPNDDILRALKNFKRSGARFLITNTYDVETNEDIPTGRWRPVNLMAPPFGLPDPMILLDERSALTPGKRLAVWKLQEL
jgi:hypothetical protein